MKHVVSIAFDFEDERVRKILSETVEQTVIRDIKQDVVDDIFEKRGWGMNGHADSKNDPIQYWVREMVKGMLEEVKEDICKQAAVEVAERLCRSPKWRQKLAEEVGARVDE